MVLLNLKKTYHGYTGPLRKIAKISENHVSERISVNKFISLNSDGGLML